MSRAVAEIQADLDHFYAERRKASIAEYSADSGQGRTAAKRSLSDINKTIELLNEEMSEATGASGQSYSVGVDRGPL